MSESSERPATVTVASDTAPSTGAAVSTAASPADPFPDDGVAEDMTPWPPPPADPTGPVAQAVADAEANGVHLAVVVIDRTTGATLTQVDQDETFPGVEPGQADDRGRRADRR